MLHWRFAPSGQGKLPMSTTNIVITCTLKNKKHYTLLHGTLGAYLSLLLLMSLTTLIKGSCLWCRMAGERPLTPKPRSDAKPGLSSLGSLADACPLK